MKNDPKTIEINELLDYSAVKKLASALWKQDEAYHGAAIMLGAGFSRCAATSGDINKKLPLWNDLSSALAQDLNSDNNSDPLRLAEEYYAYFGKQAIQDLIKREVNDGAWKPGEMYNTLLELPWSEVLTTNWDTLLERAALDINQPMYSVVNRQEDLARASTPRIVKLHGTINVNTDLVFSQEDYRKYPQKHAAFVNFARQIFIENELCLLGFSGDDPNFLQWAGWVRDNLTSHARRIYLVGALRLTSAKRKYLESINIAPIDLWDVVSDFDDHDIRHAKATEIFLQELRNLKPKQAWEWSPTELNVKTNKKSDSGSSLLERQISILTSDRKSYPGWLICPTMVRWQLQTQLRDPYPNPQNLSQMEPDSRAKLLYELAWRHNVTYEVIPSWLSLEFIKIYDPANPCILSKKQQMEIALLLLKNTRWSDDDDPEIKLIIKKTTEILKRNARYWPECSNELAFHKAIIARDKFDYPGIEKNIDNISEEEPIWKLRKSSFLGELGRYDEGEPLITEAFQKLSIQHRNDRNSIYIFSRLAWAHYMMRGAQMLKSNKPFEAFPSSYKESKCDPFSHIEYIREEISKALEKQQKHQEIEPSFEPGRYKDNSKSVSFSNTLHPILIFEGVSNYSGVPMRWDGVNFLGDLSSKLVGLDDVNGFYCFSLAIRTANSDTSDALKKVFSRIQVACIPENDADYLLNRCIKAIEYWTEKKSTGLQSQQRHAIDRLRVFIEVLARMLVRATPNMAKNAFRLAMDLGKNKSLYHFWLFDSLNNLINYSLKSVPESQHHELLLDALQFPLQAEIGFTDPDRWPNPVIQHSNKRESNTILDRRIDEIIDQIEPGSIKSGPALLRLLPLVENGFLKKIEKQKIAEKIWGSQPLYEKLPETGLLKYALLKLPSLNSCRVRALVRKSLFEAKDGDLIDATLMEDIANAAISKKGKELPNETQAFHYFNLLISWRMKNNDKDVFGYRDQIEKRKGELLGQVLAKSIVPSLLEQELIEENFNRLYSFYTEVEAPAAVMAFIYFAKRNEALITKVEKIIGKGLQDKSSSNVAYSAYALLKWREITNLAVISKLISKLIYLIESGRTVGLSELLWTANQMFNKDWILKEQLTVLVDSIPTIFDSTNYKFINHTSRDAVSVSFIRVACVRLARDILSKTQDRNSGLVQVLEEARLDPLPEVRFAETTTQQ